MEVLTALNMLMTVIVRDISDEGMAVKIINQLVGLEVMLGEALKIRDSGQPVEVIIAKNIEVWRSFNRSKTAQLN